MGIKISIIVPVYNVEKYLEQCLESIINQTYENLQIIIVNDGSTDDSASIIEYYKSLDNRIEIIHKNNTGYGHTVNIGLKKASGDYIGIVESDDFAALNMYEVLAGIAEETKADVVKGSNYEYEDGVATAQNIFEGLPCEKTINPCEYPAIFMTRCHIWAAVYKREFLLQNDIWLNETPGASYQDMSFAFKVWSQAKNVYLYNNPLIYYRVDNMSSSVHSSEKIFCVLDEVNEIDRYNKEHKVENEIIQQMRNVVAYHSYNWTMNRIDEMYRYAFFLEMKKACLIIRQSCPLEEYWPEDLWKDYQQFVTNPQQYFLNSDSVRKHKESRLDEYTCKAELCKKAIFRELMEREKIIIYGAGLRGKGILKLLKKGCLENKIIGYAVSNIFANENSIEGIPVKHITDYADRKEDSIIIVAVKEESQLDILMRLNKKGYKNVLRVNHELIEILNYY